MSVRETLIARGRRSGYTRGVSDEELLALERALPSSGVAERLRYATALLRVGRDADALAALQPAASEPAARRELARFPAWTHDEGGAGRTRCLDVAPLVRPRVAWRRELPRSG